MRAWSVAAALIVLAGCGAGRGERVAPAVQPAAREAVAAVTPRVILFVGDGAGVGAWTAAFYEAGRLAVQRLPVAGLVDTRNVAERVTDSAAGATVLASGVRTFNGAIGVGPDSLPVRTVLEEAESRGMATGLVATSSITHATPAAFAAHTVSRSAEPEIARQLAAQEIEVLLGGGRGFFDGTLRPDSANLLPELVRRYTYVDSPAALRALAMDTVDALLGLLAENGTEAAPRRGFTLAELVDAALRVLDRDPDGFFLMVEGSQIDWREHDHAPVADVIAEVLDLDAAIGVALDYQARHPETVIVVTADHETGGTIPGYDREGRLEAKYTTTGHSGAMVPLFAGGPGTEALSGLRRNTEVGEFLLRAVGAAVPAAQRATLP